MERYLNLCYDRERKRLAGRERGRKRDIVREEGSVCVREMGRDREGRNKSLRENECVCEKEKRTHTVRSAVGAEYIC